MLSLAALNPAISDKKLLNATVGVLHQLLQFAYPVLLVKNTNKGHKGYRSAQGYLTFNVP